MSLNTFISRFPTGKVPKSSRDYGKIFVCRRGCNTRTATYTEEFDWEDIYGGSQQDIYALIQRVKSETKATRSRRGPKPPQDNEKLDVGALPCCLGSKLTSKVDRRGSRGFVSKDPKKEKKTDVSFDTGFENILP